MAGMTVTRVDPSSTGELPYRSLLACDLETDWQPDPWGWSPDSLDDAPSETELFESVGSSEVQRVSVSLVSGDRVRAVPLLGLASRYVLARTGTAAAWAGRDKLADGVCAYRPSSSVEFRSYRDEYARRQALERDLARRHSHVIETDIRSFFPTTRSATVRKALETLGLRAPDGLDEILAALETALGYCLPEGYSAARALGNLCLAPVDALLDLPFTRWVDDYRIFAPDRNSAEGALADLSERIQSVSGYDLSQSKSVVRESRSVFMDDAGRSLSPDHSREVPDAAAALASLLDGTTRVDSLGRERLMRHYLRLGAERSDPRVAALIREPVTEGTLPGSAFPRLAWLIATTASEPEGQALARDVIECNSDSDWAMLRLLPALWYLPRRSVANASADIVDIADRTPWLALAALRTVARHLPQHLPRIVDRLADDGRARAVRLARLEAQGIPTSTHPPVRTFL